MPVTLRPVRPDDEAFLFELYSSTRQAELAAWGWDAAQRAAFLRLQFLAQQQHYRTALVAADQQVIERDGQPIGRLIVLRTPAEIRLADIALLPAARNTGIGITLIRALLAEAAQRGLPLRLQVALANPARRLYERLGFTVTGHTDTDWQMEARPGPSAESP